MNIQILSPSPAKKQKTTQSDSKHVMPGDVITTEPGFMRGHGTLVDGGTLIATISGVVEKVNKLISVRPLKSRYQAEVGDVVVGRITDVVAARWKVDINAKTEAALLLAAINLPSGAQRKRTQSDELQMRQYFTENDLISAEVQAIHHDGGVMLHTRSMKYGKLQNGLFLPVPAGLVKRSKAHFHTLPCGVDVILGVNGYVWITETAPPVTHNSDAIDAAEEELYKPQPLRLIGPESRERIARVRNSITVLAQEFRSINSDSIMFVYKRSTAMGMASKEMLKPDNVQKLTARTSDLDIEEETEMGDANSEAFYIK